MLGRGSNRFDRRTLLRLSCWGTAALVAVALVVATGLSESGSQRAAVAFAALSGGELPRQVTVVQLAPRSSDAEGETRRLNEAMRLLAADRDRLLTRVASLERNLDDITGSINRQAAAPRPAEENPRPSSSPPQISSLQFSPAVAALESGIAGGPYAAPALPPDAPEWLASAPAPWPNPSAAISIAPPPDAPDQIEAPMTTAAIPAESPRPAPAAPKTEFGVDIGSAPDLNSLKAIWNETKAHHPALLNGLRPVFSVRESRNGTPELRLIIGPLPNASAAARLCAALGAADVLCSTRTFEGQRLAVR
jgi:hypothetical protein